MKKATVIALAALFIFTVKISFSQNVGINTISPDPSAALHIDSHSNGPQGLLIPRVDLVSKNPIYSSIQNPALGLIAFNTSFDLDSNLVPGLYFFNGGRWQELISNDRLYNYAAFGELFETHAFNGGSNYALPLGVWQAWQTAELGLYENVTPDINGTDFLIINDAGSYEVNMSVSYQGDNSMQVSIQAFIQRGAAIIGIPKIQIHNKLNSNGDLVSGAASGVVSFQPGDKVFVQFKCENASKNIQVEVLNLSIAKISDIILE